MDQQAIDEIDAENARFIEDISDALIAFRDGVAALADKVTNDFNRAISEIDAI